MPFGFAEQYRSCSDPLAGMMVESTITAYTPIKIVPSGFSRQNELMLFIEGDIRALCRLNWAEQRAAKNPSLY